MIIQGECRFRRWVSKNGQLFLKKYYEGWLEIFVSYRLKTDVVQLYITSSMQCRSLASQAQAPATICFAAARPTSSHTHPMYWNMYAPPAVGLESVMHSSPAKQQWLFNPQKGSGSSAVLIFMVKEGSDTTQAINFKYTSGFLTRRQEMT